MRVQRNRGAEQASGCWDGIRADAWLIALDACFVVVAYFVALLMRFDGHITTQYLEPLPWFLPLAVAVHVGCLAWGGLYGRVWVQAGVAEVWPLVVASGAATASLVVAVTLSGEERVLPVSVPLNAGALALLLHAGLRYRERIVAARASRGGTGAGVVLVGPVAAARHVVAQMQADTGSELVPLAVVTDEVAAWRRSLSGVPVTGPMARLPELVQRLGGEHALLMLGDDPPALRRAVDLAHEAGLQAKVLPTVRETLGRRPGLHDIRDLSIEDLLGREQVGVDIEALRQTITGRVVLITGAGGSIGSEIAVQVSRLDPARLVLLDHDETHLHDVVAKLDRPAEPVLGDIREASFIGDLFARVQPEIVFHAAAHKHVPILEDFPSEAVRTNVLGTQILVRAAAQQGTRRFVAISTDKAVAPRSVMGASKRLAEQVLSIGRPEGSEYCAVRFGNVLGSRGSVVPTFLRQVQEGGPVTVTHPDVERFFMSVREAVELVMQAATLSEGGEVFMLDMGEPVRIADLAERIIFLSGARAGHDVHIQYTGLRPGEKLSEQLHSDDERVDRTAHPKIHRVRTTQCQEELLRNGLEELTRLALARDEHAVRALLLELARIPGEIHLDGVVLPMARKAALPPTSVAASWP